MTSCTPRYHVNTPTGLRQLYQVYIYTTYVTQPIPRIMPTDCSVSLLWRHNGREGGSNHQPNDSLLNRPFRRRSKKTLKLRVTGFVRGIYRSLVNSPHKWPVIRKMFPFDDVIMSIAVVIHHPFFIPMHPLTHNHAFFPVQMAFLASSRFPEVLEMNE